MGRRVIDPALCFVFILIPIPLAFQSRVVREYPGDMPHPDPESTRNCTYAGKSLGEWTRRLASPNPDERLSAAWALHHIGPGASAAVPALVRALDDRDEFVRSISATALGKIGPGAAEAVPAMIRALEKSRYFHQCLIGPAIAGIGTAAVPAMTTAIKDKKELRWPLIHGLSLIGPQAIGAVPVLDEMLSVHEGSVREEAACALWKIARRRDAIKVIGGCLMDEDEFARMCAADHLGEIGPEAAEVVPALIRALDDSSDAVRNRSAEALGKIGPAAKEAVPVLVHSVGRKSRTVFRPCVTEALTRIGTPAITELIRGLEDRDVHVQSVAAESLGRIGPDARQAMPALIELAKGPLRALAAEALWRIGRDERAIAILVDDLRSGDANHQLFCMDILAQFGPAGKDAIPLLIRILTQGDRFRRPEAAAATLGRIGPEARAAVPSLEAALKDPDGEIRATAGLALWRIANSEVALKALISELHGPDEHARFRAAMALGEIVPAARSAVPALIEALKGDEPNRPAITRALGQFGPDARAAVPALIAIFESTPAYSDDGVAKALMAIDPAAARAEGIR